MEWVRDFPDACLTHDQQLHYRGTFVLTAEHPPECRLYWGFVTC